MAKQPKAFIVENTLSFKKGQLLESYELLDEGIQDDKGNFLAEGKYILLTEKLSPEDELTVKEMIKLQLKALLWNLYTKSSVLIQK
jgi:hypothetical protein